MSYISKMENYTMIGHHVIDDKPMAIDSSRLYIFVHVFALVDLGSYALPLIPQKSGI